MEEKEGVRDRVLGWSVVCQRVKGGGGEESSSISHMLRHPSARQCYFEMKTNYAQ